MKFHVFGKLSWKGHLKVLNDFNACKSTVEGVGPQGTENVFGFPLAILYQRFKTGMDPTSWQHWR